MNTKIKTPSITWVQDKLTLNAQTDPSGLLQNLREMGADDNVLSIFGQLPPKTAAEILLFIADFGQRLVSEEMSKKGFFPRPIFS